MKAKNLSIPLLILNTIVLPTYIYAKFGYLEPATIIFIAMAFLTAACWLNFTMTEDMEEFLESLKRRNYNDI